MCVVLIHKAHKYVWVCTHMAEGELNLVRVVLSSVGNVAKGWAVPSPLPKPQEPPGLSASNV